MNGYHLILSLATSKFIFKYFVNFCFASTIRSYFVSILSGAEIGEESGGKKGGKNGGESGPKRSSKNKEGAAGSGPYNNARRMKAKRGSPP